MLPIVFLEPLGSSVRPGATRNAHAACRLHAFSSMHDDIHSTVPQSDGDSIVICLYSTVRFMLSPGTRQIRYTCGMYLISTSS